jgi:hypothetical protein
VTSTFKTKEKHAHEFRDYLSDATGYWQKRDCPGEGVYVKGTLQGCSCGMLRLKPDDTKLRTVEVTR